MASNGSSKMLGDTERSLARIKRQLTWGSGRHILQGPLLKRSEMLRNWNERWVILDPTTGKMEYKTDRNEVLIKGRMDFDSNSTIILSPVNFHGHPKYDGCCFYIGTPQKKFYFLCAETSGIARAWVATLRASQLVLRVHKETINSIRGNVSTTLQSVATVIAAANTTALEASKEIEAAMKISIGGAGLDLVDDEPNEAHFDELTIMKETLRVKDEELQRLAKELRAKDFVLKEIANKLKQTAEAAKAAEDAARKMDDERRFACTEIERLTEDAEKQMHATLQKLKESEEKVMVLSKEREVLLKQRDSTFQETQLWRSELVKAKEHTILLEAAANKAEERARIAEADSEAKSKDAENNAVVAAREKDELKSISEFSAITTSKST
ncbi:LOW QUALITY PROTEIN: differentially expressed in FDCP 6 homolog [Dioscorea cayenensis subsp. rotundata]|uniref:LOW QUALITY PROTEIN: differentially expressed in FDCP 6 homolog n=1 Tax=Dioscorea cayennensis subsp. rotundata TaxID=55577 RepID=A0AB40APU8_DIOCR|nr:LOW QUALITY PROTEIN: differentially expressed in FDCP 6 homolog [Dioscorea cayenensis subsp. rotundata]